MAHAYPPFTRSRIRLILHERHYHTSPGLLGPLAGHMSACEPRGKERKHSTYGSDVGCRGGVGGFGGCISFSSDEPADEAMLGYVLRGFLPSYRSVADPEQFGGALVLGREVASAGRPGHFAPLYMRMECERATRDCRVRHTSEGDDPRQQGRGTACPMRCPAATKKASQPS